MFGVVVDMRVCKKSSMHVRLGLRSSPCLSVADRLKVRN